MTEMDVVDGGAEAALTREKPGYSESRYLLSLPFLQKYLLRLLSEMRK
jgi:hypothetical protein